MRQRRGQGIPECDRWIYIRIGQKIRRIRQSKMTQEELAIKIGSTASVISRVEAGKQVLSLHYLYRIAGAIGVEVSALIPEKEGHLRDIREAAFAKLTQEEKEVLGLTEDDEDGG